MFPAGFSLPFNLFAAAAAAALFAANIAKSPSPPEMVTVPRARDVVFPALTVVINASARSRAVRIA